jgi:hypothetical protein
MAAERQRSVSPRRTFGAGSDASLSHLGKPYDSRRGGAADDILFVLHHGYDLTARSHNVVFRAAAIRLATGQMPLFVNAQALLRNKHG